MTRILLSTVFLLGLGVTAFAQSSFVVGKASASGGSVSFAAVSASSYASSTSSGGVTTGTSGFSFKGVSSGPSGGVSYVGGPPLTSQSCHGFCGFH
jgi:hypothetical protein